MPQIRDLPTIESPEGAGGAATPQGLDAQVVAGNLRSKLFGRAAAPLRCGRFEVRRRVGQGGMGVVYEAWDPDLERRVALKLLSADYGVTSEHRKRLVQEAQTLAQLRHPNIVGVYEVGVDSGRMFIALEYVEGQTVRQWLEAETRAWPEVLRVFLEAGRGLVAAHERSLVHRDFKPDNVMVADDGSVRVLDFGLAKVDAAALSELTARRDPEGVRLTQTGSMLGTPRYMSPEQFGGRGVDARSDQFAFCVALYEGLYGEHPFPAERIDTLQVAVERGEVRSEPRGTGVPRWIRSVLLRGMAARRAERWPDMSALLKHLQRDPARARRRWFAGGAVVMLGATGWGVHHWQEQQIRIACEDEVDTLEPVWGDARREQARAAIVGADLPYVEQTWGRLEVQLNGYAGAWRDARRQTCLTAELEHALDPPIAAAQRACLDDRKRSLRGLVEEVEDAPHAVVGRLVTRAGELPEIAACDDRAYILRRYNVAEQDQNWSKREAVREALVQSEKAYWLGDREESRAQADTAQRMAHELGDQELEGFALFWQGVEARDRGDFAEALGLHTRCTLAGLRVGADDVALRCANIATEDANHVGELEVAELFGNVALAIDERLGGGGSYGYRILGALAFVYLAQGRLDEATRVMEESHRLAEQNVTADDPHLGWSHANMGRIYEGTGRFQEALPHLRAAAEIARRTEGEHSRHYINARRNYAGILGYLGRHAEAEGEARRLLGLLEKAGRTDTASYAGLLADLSELARWQGRNDEALELGLEAVRIGEDIAGHDAATPSFMLAQVGWAHFELDQLEPALEYFERAMAGENTEKPRNRADLHWGLSRTLTALGREPDRALALARQAVEHCTAAGPGDVEHCTHVSAWRDRLEGEASPADR